MKKGRGEYIAQAAKDIFAKKFTYYLTLNHKTQADVVEDLHLAASTVSDWANAKSYPRVDKMMMLADYLGCTITDLREENTNYDPEVMRYLNELKNRPEMRLLFKTAINVTKEDIERAVKIIEALQK
jgi:transcriptional regulator with XRE-family HTH domain